MDMFIQISAAVFVTALLAVCLYTFVADLKKDALTEPKVSIAEKFFDWKLLLKIAGMLFVTRVFTYYMAYGGFILFGGDFESFEGIWLRCDAPRYFQIINDWYVGSGDYNDMVNIAFFPLYPFVVRCFSSVFGNPFWCGIGVSYVSLVMSCYLMYKLVLLDFDTEIAQRSVKYFLIYPFSMFLSAVYPESLFMALVLGCMYLLRKKKWVWASVLAALASACRLQGLVLVLPIGYEVIVNWRKDGWKWKYLSCLIAPMGYGAYLLINKIVTGEFFKYLQYQSEYWLHENAFFGKAITYWLPQMAADPARTFVNYGPQILMFFVFIGITVFAWRRLKGSYLVYSLGYIVASYSTLFLLSGPRYMIGAFPAFIAAAVATKNKHVDFVLTLMCIMFYTILVVAYAFDRNVL